MNSPSIAIEKENKLSFTVSFSFHNATAFFDGFTLETVVSHRIRAKYRVLVRNPDDNNLYTMKGMEEPLLQEEINQVLKEKYEGGLPADEFAFEVFDESGKRKIFATKFNARMKMPAAAHDPMKGVYTSFCWAFELPEDLKI